jgi:hypothetical protein
MKEPGHLDQMARRAMPKGASPPWGWIGFSNASAPAIAGAVSPYVVVAAAVAALRCATG